MHFGRTPQADLLRRERGREGGKRKSAGGKEGGREDITSHKGAEEKGEGLGTEVVLHYGPKRMK